jgi:hypothetical protein
MSVSITITIAVTGLPHDNAVEAKKKCNQYTPEQNRHGIRNSDESTTTLRRKMSSAVQTITQENQIAQKPEAM